VDARIRPKAGNVIAGAMNTAATAWGQQQDTRRLTPATRTDAFSPDVHSTDTEAAREEIRSEQGSQRFDQDVAASAGNPLGLNSDRGYVPQDRERSASTVSDPDFQLNRSSNEPFRREDVGAQSSQSNRLEELYDRDDADMYQASRSGQPLPGEFANAGNSPSGSQIRGNYSNASDSEFRTAEGDSRFNVSDPQLRENAPGAYQSDSGVTPELTGLRQQQETQGLGGRKGPQSDDLGSRVGRRWDRFQDRLRNEKDRITGECPECERDRDRAA